MSVIKPEMMDSKVTRHDLLPISFLKMSSYTGSKRALRYKIQKTEDGQLECITWLTGNAFDHTPEEDLKRQVFRFDDAGLDAIVVYLNEVLQENGI